MAKFRKKPVVIDAIRFDGANYEEIGNWVGLWHDEDDGPGMSEEKEGLRIETLEGAMLASPGDWVIRGVSGEFYPCKPDIFDATYEPVPQQQANEPSQTERHNPWARQSKERNEP
jgi:hypothetical protein